MAKILLVDNDPGFVNSARRVLENKGYEVMTAASGEQALAVMRKEKPALVLLEIMMSYVLEGLDLLREMANDPTLKDIPVIVVTSLKGTKVKAAQPSEIYAAVDEWLQKPVSPDQLLERVEEMLKVKAA